MTNLKIYSINFGCDGGIVVVSDSRENAFNQIQSHIRVKDSGMTFEPFHLDEHEIVNETLIYFEGVNEKLIS